MRFTEELRAWAREHQVLVGGLGLEEVADRIDERWEREESDFDLMSNKMAAQATCLVEVGEALGVSADQPDSEFYWELAEAARGCIQLPKDADGEPIRIGDVMENIVCPSVHREVTGVGVECFYGWDDGNGRYSQFDVNCYRHHHAPTVEDVLREFAQKMNENLGMYAGETIDADEWRDADAKTIAEYAAKLRLAGEDA